MNVKQATDADKEKKMAFWENYGAPLTREFARQGEQAAKDRGVPNDLLKLGLYQFPGSSSLWMKLSFGNSEQIVQVGTLDDFRQKTFSEPSAQENLEGMLYLLREQYVRVRIDDYTQKLFLEPILRQMDPSEEILFSDKGEIWTEKTGTVQEILNAYSCCLG